jgi:hypothetical protein
MLEGLTDHARNPGINIISLVNFADEYTTWEHSLLEAAGFTRTPRTTISTLHSGPALAVSRGGSYRPAR